MNLESKVILDMKSKINFLMRKSESKYWYDLIVEVSPAWTLFASIIILYEKMSSIFLLPLYCLTTIAFYYCASLMHDLSHCNSNELKLYNFVWHIFVGVPLLAPLFLYRNIHRNHHSRTIYGTNNDGEYYPFASITRRQIVYHFLYNFLIPLFSVFRFTFLTVISYFHPRMREFVRVKFSFLGLRYTFNRIDTFTDTEKKIMTLSEIACAIYILSVVFLLKDTGYFFPFVSLWYFTLVGILTLNSLRILGSTHLYLSDGLESSLNEHIMDSVNIRSHSIFTKILCPNGLQFHALHHLFPSIPYYNMKKAFEILVKDYEAHDFFSKTTKNSLLDVWRFFYQNSLSNSSK